MNDDAAKTELPVQELDRWDEYVRWLTELTALPTAAGREDRVIDWIRAWVNARDDLTIRADASGNLVIESREPDDARPRLFLTAHLDHPAFVVESVEADRVHLSFRGGVRDPYFKDAPILVHIEGGAPIELKVVEAGPADPFRDCVAELVEGDLRRVSPGDIARWKMRGPEIEGDLFRTHACDDLAALAAALAAVEELRVRAAGRHVAILLTRAEEVGFIGAIAACRDATMPRDAKVIALENSRSFADSPIGGGPIVRVGDRMSTFNPELTASVGRVAERLREAAEKQEIEFNWQRKLMPGGACEATAYQAWGWQATCVCLPLGNYHNMARLAEVLDGDEEAVATARADREYISLCDYRDLIKLLAACGLGMADVEPIRDRLDRLFEKTRFVLTGEAQSATSSNG